MSRNKSIALIALSPILFALSLTGCSDNHGQPTTRPSTADDRQAAALKDPWGYGGSTEKVDISGGDIKTLDRKALKRDVDSVFNP